MVTGRAPCMGLSVSPGYARNAHALSATSGREITAKSGKRRRSSAKRPEKEEVGGRRGRRSAPLRARARLTSAEILPVPPRLPRPLAAALTTDRTVTHRVIKVPYSYSPTTLALSDLTASALPQQAILSRSRLTKTIRHSTAFA